MKSLLALTLLCLFGVTVALLSFTQAHEFDHFSQFTVHSDWPNRRKQEQDERIRRDYENAEKHKRHWLMKPPHVIPRFSSSQTRPGKVGWPNRRKEEQDERIRRDYENAEKHKRHWLMLQRLLPTFPNSRPGMVGWPNRRKQEQDERIRRDYENEARHKRHWLMMQTGASRDKKNNQRQNRDLVGWPNRRKEEQDERIRRDYENEARHKRHWLMMQTRSQQQQRRNSSCSNKNKRRHLSLVGWPNRRKEQQEERIRKDYEKKHKQHWMMKKDVENLEREEDIKLDEMVHSVLNEVLLSNNIRDEDEY
ncbi:hypothetical protein C9374_010780 [Naegleria lovaniensis]|uniref:Uncharacterized protein n=1 Tax=Naegleria lovaniensis TaxID=51637 RepID=A0AA88KFY4_NAELO|nr:uncharacterized protein C9374_010780 [Naegleria lovaniensis]KAG2374496.1 hypothetical protein C9374_010780 [Naegleria lovaniensis]